MFEVTSNDAVCTKALITSSILDALSVLGALEHYEEAFLVVAPGSPKGLSPGDVQTLAARFEHVTVLGRGGAQFVEQFQKNGLSCSLAAQDCQVGATLTASTNAARVIRQWLETSTILAPPPVGHDLAETAARVAASVTFTPERDEVFVKFAVRCWRIRGARSSSNVDGEHLQVALSVNEENTGRFHLDVLDLYLARLRHGFLDAASTELHASREALVLEMAEVLGVAERTRDDRLHDTPEVVLSDLERRAALAYLEDPDLVTRLTRDLGDLGVVGEATNLLVCYLATISRKCDAPLGVLVQSSSAGGKSTLVDAVCSLVPPEDLVALSAITSQALYYLGGSGLARKVLCVAEEHGSKRASYALKLLLSEGRLAIATTGKDQASGRLATTNYETTGPVALLMTTTSTSIDPELENRLVVLGVDEDPRQTKAIIMAQRRNATSEGIVQRRHREELRVTHANVQRLLQPFRVVINDLDEDFPSHSTRHRRDHAKLLALITAITVLHQFQREQMVLELDGETVTYLVASAQDIRLGLSLASQVVTRSDDHLAPQAQRLLGAFEELVGVRAHESDVAPSDVEVTRRELRELLGWSLMQVRTTTDALVALEYLVVSGAGRGRCRTYRLVGAMVHVGGVTPPTFSRSSSGTSAQLVELVPDSVARSDDAVSAPYEQVEVAK
jgi:hypothetical protein